MARYRAAQRGRAVFFSTSLGNTAWARPDAQEPAVHADSLASHFTRGAFPGRVMRLGLGLGLARTSRAQRADGTAFVLSLAYAPPNGASFSLSLAYQAPNGQSATLTLDPTGWDGNPTTITLSYPATSQFDNYLWDGSGFSYQGSNGSSGAMSSASGNTITSYNPPGGGEYNFSYSTDSASNVDSQISFDGGAPNTGWDGNATNVTVTGPAGADTYAWSGGAFTFVSGTGMSSASGSTITGDPGGAGYSYSTDNASNADSWISFTDGTAGTGWDGVPTNVTLTGPAGTDVYSFNSGSFTFVSGTGMSTASGATIIGNNVGRGYSYSTDGASNADGWITFTDGTNG